MSNNIALLCGRGGSVSVCDKNLYPVLGRLMMMYILLAGQSILLLRNCNTRG